MNVSKINRRPHYPPTMIAASDVLCFPPDNKERRSVTDSNEPLFERLGNVDELQHHRQKIDSLQSRVQDLERINLDLEDRLEDSAKQCMGVEKECVAVEKIWNARTEELEKEIATWRRSFDAQKMKTDKLREHLSRTEKELYSILQRKYELMRGPGRGGPGTGAPGGGTYGGSYNAAKQSDPRGYAENRGNGDFKFHHPNSKESRGSGTSDKNASYGDIVDSISYTSIFPEDPYAAQEAHAPQEIRQHRMLVSLTDFLNL